MGENYTKITYDSEEDIVNFSRGRPSRASIEVGDFIIDIDGSGFVSAIEIINASENLNIQKEILENIQKIKMSVLYKPNYLFISLVLNVRGIEKDIRIPLAVDLGHSKVEREEMVFRG
jgi:uncharacterized protein YuzE